MTKADCTCFTAIFNNLLRFRQNQFRSLNQNHKIIWKYFLDINLFNLSFCLIFAFVFGILWSIFLFATFGIIVGYLGFKTFKSNEYYSYYNLGITKKHLLKRVLLYNATISFFIFIIYLIFT